MIDIQGAGSLLVNCGINDNSLPATVDTYVHSKSVSFSAAKASIRTEASYFNAMRTGNFLDLQHRQHFLFKNINRKSTQSNGREAIFAPLKHRVCDLTKSYYVQEDFPQQSSRGLRLGTYLGRDS